MCDAHLDIALLHLGSHQTHPNPIQLKMLIKSLFTLHIQRNTSTYYRYKACPGPSKRLVVLCTHHLLVFQHLVLPPRIVDTLTYLSLHLSPNPDSPFTFKNTHHLNHSCNTTEQLYI
jgi:hypothetical protein